MFFKKRRTRVVKLSPVPVLSDRMAPDPQRLDKHPRLLHYFADLPFNEANPHRLKANTVTGVEAFTHSNEAIEQVAITPSRQVLKGPDKSGKGVTGEIELHAWLKQKLTKEEWETRADRDNLIRALTAMLLEGEADKVALVNQFIQSIGPYKKPDHANKTQINPQSELHFQTIRAVVYSLLGGFNTFQIYAMSMI